MQSISSSKRGPAIKRLLRRVSILLLISVTLSCEQARSLDANGNGIVNGRVFYKGKDYGPLAFGDSAFHRALGDTIAELAASGASYRQGFIAEMFRFGKFYCFEKRLHSESELTADIVQAAAGKYRSLTSMPANASDEVMSLDIAAVVADKTLCPNGYPNPMQSFQ